MNRQQLQTRHFRQLGAFLSCWGATTVVWSQSVEGAREAHTPVLIQSTALEYRQFEKVEITGSSIVRKEQTQALPVLSVTREDIRRSGKQSVTEVIQGLPSMSNYVEAAQFSTTAGGFSTGAIHGLTNGTLILVNGRRLAPFGLQTIAGSERSAVSLNTIPLADVDRIEVLSDGASSLYGTDAIAGVINIILRSERQGFEISALSRTPYQNKGAGWTTQMAWGQGKLARDGYSILLSAEVSHQDELLGKDRPYVSQGVIPFTHQDKNYLAKGSANYIAIPSAPASYYQSTTVPKYFNYLYKNGECSDGSVYFIPTVGNGHCRINNYLNLGIYPKQDTKKLHTNTQIMLDSGHKWFADGLYGETQESRATNIWPYFYTSISSSPNSLDYKQAVAAGLTPSKTVLYWRPDLSPLELVRNEKNWQFSTGFTGEFAGWDYRSSIYKAQAKAQRGGQSIQASEYLKLTAFSRANIMTALDDANPLTAQLKGMVREPIIMEKGKTELTALEWRGSRPIYEWDGKDVMLGVGVDWREEATVYEKLSDFDAPASFKGKRRIAAGYTELAIPVSFNWDVNLALRHDAYSDVGPTTNGKISSRWAINTQWAMRGAWGTGFRAPTVGQLQRLDSDFRWGTTTYTNPCTAALVAIAANLKNSQGKPGGCSTTSSLDIYGNGNPDLKPEKSKQESLGFAFTPNSNLRLSFDYWRININNAIMPMSDMTIIQNPNSYKSNFLLNGNNFISMYIPLENIGETQKSGVDLEAQWRVPTEWGRLSMVAQGTYMLNSKQKKSNEIKYNSDLGRYSEETQTVIPRFKSRIMTSLSTADWTGSLVMNYVASYTDMDIMALNLATMKDEKVSGRKVSSYLTWDVISTYAINKKLDAHIGIFNLLNQQAPLSFSQTSLQVFGANTINSQLWGRTVQVGATLRF
jgi:iron complex outermembrane receptor protein